GLRGFGDVAFIHLLQVRPNIEAAINVFAGSEFLFGFDIRNAIEKHPGNISVEPFCINGSVAESENRVETAKPTRAQSPSHARPRHRNIDLRGNGTVKPGAHLLRLRFTHRDFDHDGWSQCALGMKFPRFLESAVGAGQMSGKTFPALVGNSI